jgi:glutamine amidotransferase
MCELLGLSFNQPISPTISFGGFRHRSEKNPHGWGLAFYHAKSAQIIKEPIKAKKSPLSKFLQQYQEVKSTIFIGHVRYASVGSISHENTHPFDRELNGKAYVFAHNGTLSDYNNLEIGRFKPIGETDSEYAFCHLLSCIEKRNIAGWGKEDFDWLAEKLKEVNEYGDFNCIFSDGEHLFCHYDKNGYNGLCFVQRKPPYGEIRLSDEDWTINLAGEKRPEQTGYIIATRRLTDEPWKGIDFGELIVFKYGQMVYSNCRDVSETSKVSLHPTFRTF